MNKKEAINEHFDVLNITQTMAASMLGTTPQQVNAYICGRKKFGRETAIRWSKTFGFNPEWLMYDEGPMLKEQMMGTNITVGDFNVTQGENSYINAHSNIQSSELEIENASLKAEIKHLNEMMAQKDDMIKAQERTIGILLKTN